MQKVLLCCLLLALALAAAPFGLRAEEETKTGDVMERIPWDEVPEYIQNQVKHVILSCTEGTLTPNRARTWRYTSSEHTEVAHYVVDFSPWQSHPVTPTCSYGPRVCEETGCFMMAYSQLDASSFKLSLRLGVDMFHVTSMEGEGGEQIPVVELTLSPYQCRVFNDQSGKCKMRFTWHGGKFRLFGFGSVSNVEDPSETKYRNPDGSFKPLDAMGNPLPEEKPQ